MQFLPRVLEAISWAIKSHSLLFTSFYELETHILDSLREKLSLHSYHVGPTIPYMTLQDMPPKAVDHTHMEYYFGCLDSQPKSCILYVSLGSFLSVTGPQTVEIAIGLRASGVIFLWAARGNTVRLQEASEDWKICLRVKEEIEGKIVVRGQEIARIVKWLMDLDEEESNELRKRAIEMKEICKRAIEKGGSSGTNLGAFVKEIVQGHKNQSN
ncbi:UDP-glycosyltransferase 87A1-like protein [Cinnamomum micranthum f. kanehirae]|uniref:UDP-glycosyltransferase 87A1-like protein n=1 Tax=Cinnamomum micranthum f. kanehirae TaxID=337451 RepID=A0A443NC05_9MAGN|nr:UDP-glycosyltransferase 87A1-like protein [Cinnamomum micranthum f. kanehirae]